MVQHAGHCCDVACTCVSSSEDWYFGCRSDLASADDDKTDEKEDDFVKGFKVANFEIIDSPDKGTCSRISSCTSNSPWKVQRS